MLTRKITFIAMLLAVVSAALCLAVRTAPARPAVASSSKISTGLVTSLGKRRSHNGRYSAEVVATSPIAIGAGQSWTIHLARRTQRVARADVTADAWMPEEPARERVHPAVHYIGGGDYRLDSLSFPRAGGWYVALVIDGRYGTDSVAFNVVLPAVARE